MNPFKRYNLVSNRQYRFIKGQSTGHHVLKVFNNETEVLDSSVHIDIVFLDFMKAFVKVP